MRVLSPGFIRLSLLVPTMNGRYGTCTHNYFITCTAFAADKCHEIVQMCMEVACVIRAFNTDHESALFGVYVCLL